MGLRVRKVLAVEVDRPLRVAFIDHCALLSGGELALARMLPALQVDAHVVLAEDGPLVQLRVLARRWLLQGEPGTEAG